MEEFIPKIKENKEISPDDKMLMLTRIEKTKNQLNEKEHQLRVKKGVSLQDCAIIDRIAENNYFLLNNINMASEVLVPTLRQNVILGQEAQRQDIQNTVINNISKVTNDIVEVTLNIKTPDVTTNLQKYSELMNNNFLNEKEMKNLNNFSEDEIFDKIITKMFSSMKQAFQKTDKYASMKTTIYLEKDNGKWGIAELDEKLKNFREIYKSVN